MQVSAERFLLLEMELKVYKNALNKAIDVMLDKGIEYPIFIAHQDSFEVGIPIIDRYKVSGNWNINVSSMEEFIKHQLIKPGKIDSFKKNYKPVEDFICFFVLSELGAQYIYLPRV